MRDGTTPTLSIFNGAVVLLEHLTRAAGECLGAVEIPVMDEIRTHHSVEFVQSTSLLSKDIVKIGPLAIFFPANFLDLSAQAFSRGILANQ